MTVKTKGRRDPYSARAGYAAGDRLLDIPEAAVALGIKEPTLRQWLSQRRLGYVKVGRLTKLWLSELQSFADDNAVLANEPAHKHEIDEWLEARKSARAAKA